MAVQAKRQRFVPAQNSFIFRSRTTSHLCDMIDSPRHTYDYPDRHAECEAALETGLISLIEDAHGSGWKVAETIAAIISLADHYMLKSSSVKEMDEYLARLKMLKD